MGTSMDMLEKLYVEKNSKQDWSELTYGGYKRNPNSIRVYDDSGNVMAYVKRNTAEHQSWYDKYPQFTEKPLHV